MQAVPEAGSAADALAAFHAAQGLPFGGGSSARRWKIVLGPLRVPVPNFGWRSQALPVHDLHHLLTGYPCSPAGEFEMAAWEFAAGRYPHAGATAFCLPLVGIGAVACPRRTYAAFLRGRASQTLYARGLTPEVLTASVAELRRTHVPTRALQPRPADRLAYAGWVFASWTWILVPVAVLAALVLA